MSSSSSHKRHSQYNSKLEPDSFTKPDTRAAGSSGKRAGSRLDKETPRAEPRKSRPASWHPSMRYKPSQTNSKKREPLVTIPEDASSSKATAAVKVIPQDKWENYCDALISRIASEIKRVEGLNSQVQDLRKNLNGDVMFPTNEDSSLLGMIASNLYYASISEEDRRRTEQLRKRQLGDRRVYQLSLDVFAQEPEVVAAQLQHLEEQVRTMRAAPSGTIDTFCRCEREWLWLVRHADGIRWHIEEAARYATRMRACSDHEERTWLTAELKWLIESHADTIYWHFIQMQPFEDEKQWQRRKDT